MFGEVVVLGLPSGKGADYFLRIGRKPIVSTKTPDPNPPTKEAGAAYFETSGRRIKEALFAYFPGSKANKIWKELKESLGKL
jgi:hypothetical protein